MDLISAFSCTLKMLIYVEEQVWLLGYPKVGTVHNYEKESYKNKNLLSYHIKSAIRYINKWSWFFDKERSRINNQTLRKLNYKKI